MPGEILKPRPEGGELADAWMPRVAARLLQVACQHRLRILVTPVLDEPGEPVLHVAGQPERLADFAGGAAAPYRARTPRATRSRRCACTLSPGGSGKSGKR